MGFYGPNGNDQVPRNCLVGVALGQQLQHLAFALAQWLKAGLVYDVPSGLSRSLLKGCEQSIESPSHITSLCLLLTKTHQQ